MKRLLFPALLALCLLTGCACSNQHAVLASLPRYESRSVYSEGDWQDFTDYGVYRYAALTDEALAASLLRPVTEAELPRIGKYLDNHRSWVELAAKDSRLARHYDFDAACLDPSDWFLIQDKADMEDLYRPFDSYDLWIYDAQTCTLYFFHNNI